MPKENVAAALDGTAATTTRFARPLTYDLSFPNGLALSADESFLFVSDSNKASPSIYRYSVRFPREAAKDSFDALLAEDEEDIDDEDDDDVEKQDDGNENDIIQDIIQEGGKFIDMSKLRKS